MKTGYKDINGREICVGDYIKMSEEPPATLADLFGNHQKMLVQEVNGKLMAGRLELETVMKFPCSSIVVV